MCKAALKILMALIVIFSLFGIFACYTSTQVQTKFTTAEIREIYQRLVVNVGEGNIPPLIITQDDTVNAWTDGVNVTITSGILETMTNKDEVALVLSHEIAHAINNDVARTDQEQIIKEAHADKMGAFIMMRAGFDVCKGREVFMEFEKLYGDTPLVGDHPGFAYRADQLNMPWCHYGY